LVLDEGDPEPGVCEECGYLVDADGKSVVWMGPNGPIAAGVIRLEN
jgi:hypothetical protein